ncbi:MAG TPA: dimethylsulfonioproprionate lyase family protein [Candidatus Dormibacteraeota bacterium]
MAPGEGVAPRAPLRHVTRLAEEPGVRLAGIQGHPDDGGTFWALVARYVNGAEEFDFGVYALEPGEYHPRHFHPAGAEFYYILEGSGLVTIGDEDVEAAPGTAFYMPAGTVHAVRTRAGEKLTMVYGFSSGDFRDTGTTWLE